MLIFSYLLRFLHREGRTGDLARAGLLFLMELAMGRKRPGANCDSGVMTTTLGSQPDPDRAQLIDSIAVAFGEWILDSDFADVLGAGLGAAYGLLPSKLVIEPQDHSVGDQSGGMVLGGMGTHMRGDRVDSEQDKEESERERRHERLLIGLGVSSSEEFKSQMNLFLKLVQFAQDVLRNTSPSTLDHYTPTVGLPPQSKSSKPNLALGVVATTKGFPASTPSIGEPSSTRDPTPAEIIASAISSAILFSIRKLFLNAIIYPSMLECSEYDGSAVAVMSYLEAILSILETDGEMADNLLRFLMAEDDKELDLGDAASTYHSPGKAGDIIHLESSGETKKRRRKSGAIQAIRADFQQARLGGQRPGREDDGLMGETGITYFNSWGRFTLKDLLVNNVRSGDGRTATAALKLLHVILVRHDRYGLPLFDIVPDPKATAFPFPLDLDEGVGSDLSGGVAGSALLTESGCVPDEEEEEEFVYPHDEGLERSITEEQTGEFRYFPSPDHRTSSEEEGEAEVFTYPISDRTSSVKKRNQSLPVTHHVRKVRSRYPSYQSHLEGLDHLARLIELIEPSTISLKADSPQASLSTAFGHYLLDAQAELTGTATFRRGLLLDHVGASVVPRRCEMGGGCSKAEEGKLRRKSELDLVDHPVIRHGLSAEAPLVSSLLESLAEFFIHPPEVNLVLTGCVAALASCPTRSLNGWLLPSEMCMEEQEEEEEEEEDDDDDDDKEVEEVGMLRSGGRDEREWMDFDEGDDRSVDFFMEECLSTARQESCGGPKKVGRAEGMDEEEIVGASGKGGCILSVYQQLAGQVAGYRREISNFDRFLKERRQGLIFVENLEDALDTATGTAETMIEPESLSTPRAAPERRLPGHQAAKQGDGSGEQVGPGGKVVLKNSSRGYGQLSAGDPSSRGTHHQAPLKAKEVSSFFASLFKPGGRKTSPFSSTATHPQARSFDVKTLARSGGEGEEALLGNRIPDRGLHTQTCRPFSEHYQLTGAIKLDVARVATPGCKKKSGGRSGLESCLSDDLASGDDGVEGNLVTPTSKTQNVAQGGEEGSGAGVGGTFRGGTQQPEEGTILGGRGGEVISLSMLLDNVVVLEEAIKELGAIVSARKSLGIDPVRFLIGGGGTA